MADKANKQSRDMDNVFHQTDETFYETQYSKGFPSHFSASSASVRPASANDGGLQMKHIMEAEQTKPKEQQYREQWHQTHRSQQDPVGGQKFLHTVGSLNSVQNITHGTRSKVENNFSDILFPGYDATMGGKRSQGIRSNEAGDAGRSMVTHGKPSNSDRSGGCLWKIFHPETAASPEPCGRRGKRNVTENMLPAGRTLDRCDSASSRRYNTITQEAEHEDAPAINKALQYLHKLRMMLSRSGAVQSTRKELQQAEAVGIMAQKCSDWNAVLLKYIGMEGSLDYGVLDPLLRKFEIDVESYEGFIKFLDLLDSEISLTQFELGKRMQHGQPTGE